jgi:putative CocE/NonD family hydrolase
MIKQSNAGKVLAALVLPLAVLGAPMQAGAQPAEAAFGAQLPQARNDTVMTSMFIAMPDGTRLAADIYRPAKDGVALEGKFPVVLHHVAARSRLGDQADRSGAGRFSTQMINLASHGYVYVVVERRGMGASFGVRRGYHDRTEAGDAFALTEWAAAQPWSTGRIGVYGCSNTGDAAMHFLTNASPKLGAVFAGCFNWDKYSGGMRGGVLANWGTGPQSNFEMDMKATPVDGDEQRVLLRQAALEHAPNTVLLDLWSGMPYRDTVSPLTGTAFWEEGSIGTYVDKVRASKVPVYIQAGWLDDFRAQAFITLANLSQPAKLIIGPWAHCESANFSMTAEALRFFDYWLKDAKNGIMDEAPVHYATMNAKAGQEWRASATWPPKTSKPVASFLGTPASRPGRAANDYSLAPVAPRTSKGEASFTVDYHAVCSKGTGLGPTCPQDDKGLTFTSAPLSTDLELTGHPIADLWVSSSVDDGPLFAYLEDVAPDGAITMVSEGRLRASLRTLNPAPYKLPAGIPWHGFYQADARPLTSGKPTQLVFDLLPVSYVFKAGHSYRLTLTGADPREKLRKESNPAPTWTVLFDAAHPSHLTLPVVR